ncbi:hypothetical protein [Streptomyces sp. VRA16 Mangrove soil]|uniref:hypothetical protein n=1 Tax=Streptomyces sp. VRA16 Mangrove soil TaxID=2817434 RepID=UPI001A9DF562|nr:hypothetical protein [Streptomyces sp. VRA16 Mangrove soil]MBO1337947.1 hypothetical protein [Streptomyces sp. VRA16 Mangrove soil]
MFFSRRRPAPRARQLLVAAGLNPKAVGGITDFAACRTAAFHAAHRDADTLPEVLALAETLLSDEADYEFVVGLLENIQNLTSHGLPQFRTRDEVEALLAPRSAVCWNSLTEFWTSVADWCADNGLEPGRSEELLSVQDEQLRALLWTTNRTLPTGGKLGLAHAVHHEKAGEPAVPGYSHIAAALRSTGRG